VQQLLTFSRQRTLRPQTMELASDLRNTVDLLKGALPVNVGVEIEISPDLWQVQIDPGELELALLNLATNARDAMPDGGVIRIEAKNLVLGEGDGSALAGEFVALGVTDTGVGFASAVLERIFEPFVTTKPGDKGSGLGLSQVYGFATQSGGTVEIDSEAGRGTCVTIYLPRSLPDPT
jgi:signal transduction histidine kinase